MKWNAANGSERGGRAPGAFTLIEMIGVLALIAVLAALAVTVSLRHLDQVASEQEMARLQGLGGALQNSILRTRYIPAYTNWATTLAAQAGMDIGAVTNNLRNHLRVLLVDSSGWLSTNLPYTQTYLGSTNLPAKARMMLVSSLGKDLPIASGMPIAADFAALWDAPPGTVPSSGAWVGWTGDPDDVKIHRMNLSPLFVQLVLTSYMSVTNGQYAVDLGQTNLVPFNAGFGAYFLTGTILKFYHGPPDSTLDSTQILNENSSFVYEGGMWKNSLQGRLTAGVPGSAGIVAAFLAATPNTNAQNAFTNYQQILVVRAMTDYLSNYSVWADGNFTNATLKAYLVDLQKTNMMVAVHGLYSASYYPTNGAP